MCPKYNAPFIHRQDTRKMYNVRCMLTKSMQLQIKFNIGTSQPPSPPPHWAGATVATVLLHLYLFSLSPVLPLSFSLSLSLPPSLTHHVTHTTSFYRPQSVLSNKTKSFNNTCKVEKERYRIQKSNPWSNQIASGREYF